MDTLAKQLYKTATGNDLETADPIEQRCYDYLSGYVKKLIIWELQQIKVDIDKRIAEVGEGTGEHRFIVVFRDYKHWHFS